MSFDEKQPISPRRLVISTFLIALASMAVGLIMAVDLARKNQSITGVPKTLGDVLNFVIASAIYFAIGVFILWIVWKIRAIRLARKERTDALQHRSQPGNSSASLSARLAHEPSRSAGAEESNSQLPYLTKTEKHVATEPVIGSVNRNEDVSGRLKLLDGLWDQGLISDEERKAQRRRILDEV